MGLVILRWWRWLAGTQVTPVEAGGGHLGGPGAIRGEPNLGAACRTFGAQGVSWRGVPEISGLHLSRVCSAHGVDTPPHLLPSETSPWAGPKCHRPGSGRPERQVLPSGVLGRSWIPDGPPLVLSCYSSGVSGLRALFLLPLSLPGPGASGSWLCPLLAVCCPGGHLSSLLQPPYL